MCVPYGGIIVHLLSMSLFLIIMKNIGTINDIFPPKHVKSIISGHYLSPKQDVPSSLFFFQLLFPMLSLCSLSRSLLLHCRGDHFLLSHSWSLINTSTLSSALQRPPPSPAFHHGTIICTNTSLTSLSRIGINFS